MRRRRRRPGRRRNIFPSLMERGAQMERCENSPRSAMASLQMQRTFRPSSAGAAPLRRDERCANDPRQKAFDMLKAPDESR